MFRSGAFLRDHFRNYAEITAPLEAIKRSTASIQWTPLDSHWQQLKRAFSTAPILSYPDLNKRLVLATDVIWMDHMRGGCTVRVHTRRYSVAVRGFDDGQLLAMWPI